jgi:hypothetical protein
VPFRLSLSILKPYARAKNALLFSSFRGLKNKSLPFILSLYICVCARDVFFFSSALGGGAFFLSLSLRKSVDIWIEFFCAREEIFFFWSFL